MQKVILVVTRMENDVIISQDGQFTGVMDEEFIYAKAVLGCIPRYIKIPKSQTFECTEQYKEVKGFSIRECHISRGEVGLNSLRKYFYPIISADIEAEIDDAIKAEHEEINAQ